MGCLWKKCANDYGSSARVVDGSLILSLPDAVNPVVWRMELGNVKTSALEVRSVATDGTFMLALKTPKGDVHDIAPFDAREKAVEALMRVSAALQSAEGRMNAPSIVPITSLGASQTDKSEKHGMPSKLLLIVGSVLVLLFLFLFLTSSTTGTMTEADGNSADVSPQTNSENGMPQPADQMLKGF